MGAMTMLHNPARSTRVEFATADKSSTEGRS